ncbi:MAG: sugar transferase [Muribaculaceae bacterium]|nr:sugar transferase [Muribaculaceae bacterium]
MYRYIKRCVDILCASIGIIGTAPVWLIAIGGILISDPGKILYVSTRLGKDNKPFKMYKFRSMKVDQSADESSLRADSSRIFPFGNLMRQLKIDELPQLINVLNGSMSVIGPRPVAVDQKHLFRVGRWNKASRVSVGLSGPAALYDFIYGDEITDEDEYMKKVYPTRRELEFVYVNKMGFLYDAKMIYYTIVGICYRVLGKNPHWMLRNLICEAEESMNANKSVL